MLDQIGLASPQHPNGKRDVERPCESNCAKEPAAIGLNIHESANPAVEHKNKNAVNREKIGGERNPEIIRVGDNIATIPANTELAYFAAH